MGISRSKILARLKAGDTTVKTLIRHPMETGNRTDPRTGLKVPRHFVQEVTCEHNGRPVMTAVWSWAVSRNPYLAFQIKGGQRGDRVTIRWRDNKGASETLETRVR